MKVGHKNNCRVPHAIGDLSLILVSRSELPSCFTYYFTPWNNFI